MFLIRMFKKSFVFKGLLKNVNEKLWKYIVYFIILMLIANFPQTLEVIRYEGTRLDFVVEDFETSTPTNWVMPSKIEIKGGKLVNNGDLNRYIYEHQGITYIINNTEKIDVNDYKNHIIFSEESIMFIDAEGNFLEEFGYRGFTDIFRFIELNLASGEYKVEIYNDFARSIESSFSRPIVLYTIIRNNLTQIFVNIIYIIILALLVQLFRFRFQNFLSFIEGIKFVILSLGLPAVLTLIIGIFSPAFTPVVFQLSSGMTIMLVMLVFSKRTFS